MVRYLMERGADKENADKVGFNPLMVAAFYDHLPVVRYLVERGADVNKARLDNGYTPLCMVAQNGHLEVAQYLREH